MPLMEFEVQRETAKFYKNRKDIMKDFISYNIRENEEELNKIENYLALIDKAWMEMEYVKYLQNKAENFREKDLLEKSCNIIYNLDDYYVHTIDEENERNWIYECELCDFKIKLLEKKREIKERLINSYVSVGVSLALLRD